MELEGIVIYFGCQIVKKKDLRINLKILRFRLFNISMFHYNLVLKYVFMSEIATLKVVISVFN